VLIHSAHDAWFYPGLEIFIRSLIGDYLLIVLMRPLSVSSWMIIAQEMGHFYHVPTVLFNFLLAGWKSHANLKTKYLVDATRSSWSGNCPEFVPLRIGFKCLVRILHEGLWDMVYLEQLLIDLVARTKFGSILDLFLFYLLCDPLWKRRMWVGLFCDSGCQKKFYL